MYAICILVCCTDMVTRLLTRLTIVVSGDSRQRCRRRGFDMTRKQIYMRALHAQPAQWIAASAASPSPTMTRTHVALHLIELRRRARIAAYWADVATVEGWQ
jgi:hypothetical protein